MYQYESKFQGVMHNSFGWGLFWKILGSLGKIYIYGGSRLSNITLVLFLPFFSLHLGFFGLYHTWFFCSFYLYHTCANFFSYITPIAKSRSSFHLVLFTICLFHQRWKYPLIVSPGLFCILITLTCLCSPLLYHTYHFCHFNCLLTKLANFSFVWLFKYHT